MLTVNGRIVMTLTRATVVRSSGIASELFGYVTYVQVLPDETVIRLPLSVGLSLTVLWRYVIFSVLNVTLLPKSFTPK